MGGVHPEENKISNDAAIEVMPVGKQMVVLMNQHLGAPATPIVQKGDKVWDMFSVKGKSEHAWHYRELVKALSDLRGTEAFEEFSSLVERVFGKEK